MGYLLPITLNRYRDYHVRSIMGKEKNYHIEKAAKVTPTPFNQLLEEEKRKYQRFNRRDKRKNLHRYSDNQQKPVADEWGGHLFHKRV
ncbi:hypothetical protein AB4Y30_05975 [Ornithinibacillus sp. 4-3]|uniref:Uncharacterized protein n=1 Tax=Ornithinibacillus sp. 4-3 TaxID=3231488 RepID=A0AB39HNH0_9BACI